MAMKGTDKRLSELRAEPIPDHDGFPVTSTVAKITKTGDGLSEAMAMAPIHVPVGTRVMIVIPAMAVEHKYKQATAGTGKDKITLDEWVETTVFEAQGATFVDADLVSGVVDEHMERVADERHRIEQERRAAKGEFPLPDIDGGPTPEDPA